MEIQKYEKDDLLKQLSTLTNAVAMDRYFTAEAEVKTLAETLTRLVEKNIRRK